MATININIGQHTCTPPELLNVSRGSSAGTDFATFQIQFDSIGQWYHDNVDLGKGQYDSEAQDWFIVRPEITNE